MAITIAKQFGIKVRLLVSPGQCVPSKQSIRPSEFFYSITFKQFTFSFLDSGRILCWSYFLHVYNSSQTLYLKLLYLPKHLNLWPSGGFTTIPPKRLLGIECLFVWCSWPQWSHLYLLWMHDCSDLCNYRFYAQLSIPLGRWRGIWGL